MAREAKAEEAEKLMKKANKLYSPSLLDMRLKPDWEGAAPLFEKAALSYKQSGQLEKSRSAYEKAAQSQEKIGSAWHAAKHLEACGALSRELAELPQVADFSRQAAQLYVDAGRASAGAEAMVRAAKLLEEAAPTEAAALYEEALELYEQDGKEGQAGDAFRAAVALLIKAARWADAVGTLLRFGQACDGAGARSSQCKAYLGAVALWLHAGDAKQAWETYQDVLAIPAFASSDEAFSAEALLSAYASGKGAERVRAVASVNSALKHLDAHVARLAVKLPSSGSDVAAMGRQLAALMGNGGGAGGGGGGDEDEEDEDLT